jgi:hypothetical protein
MVAACHLSHASPIASMKKARAAGDHERRQPPVSPAMRLQFAALGIHPLYLRKATVGAPPFD